MSDLAYPEDRGGEMAPLAGGRSKALRLLPAEMQKPVGFFWALYRHFFASPVPLVLRIQVWVAKEGLTAGEVKEVLNRMTTPEASARHRFASDVLCDLAEAVGQMVKLRRQLEERERYKQQKSEGLPPDDVSRQVRDIIDGIGERP